MALFTHDPLKTCVYHRLPDIQSEIVKQLRIVNEDLAELPAPNFTEPRSEVVRLLREFDKKLSALVEGTASADPSETSASTLMHEVNQVFERFKQSVFATTPHFCPWSSNLQVDETVQRQLMKTASQFDAESDAVWDLEDPNVYYLEDVMDMAHR